MKLFSINPSDNSIIGEVDITTKKQIKELVELAHLAKQPWRDMGIERRNKVLHKFYSKLEQYTDELAMLESQEMGMPIRESKYDVTNSISYLRWYSDNATKYLSPEISYESEHEIHTVYREPRGVIVAITSWNFPLSNFVWQCGQALVAGNVVILKHSEEVILFCKKLEAIAIEAGFPKGVLNFVYGGSKAGDFLVHQNIDMICFTGSTAVGKYLYEVASKKFIPAMLEMGGSAPGIIFKDVDIEKVIENVMANCFINCGQVCGSLKRLIVHEHYFNEVIKLLTDRITTKKVGNALDKKTEIGPLATRKLVKNLEIQIEDARTKGATIVTGGKKINSLPGTYYLPTLITNVIKDMKIWNEEVFGPVLQILSFETEAEAIKLANDTLYGLGAYIFTNDKTLMNQVAMKIQSGMVGQNNVSFLRQCNPFGGYKLSGMGREHGKYGFYDVTQIKVVSTER